MEIQSRTTNSPVRLETFGDEFVNNGIILISSRHGAGRESKHGQRLLESIDFNETPFSKETAKDYIDLEQDAGADELARALASKLAIETRLKVYMVSCGIPRAFIDGNRLDPDYAVRLLGEYMPDELKGECLESLGFLNHLIQILNQSAKYKIGIHSMWPYSPLEATEGINAVAKNIPLKEQINRYLMGVKRRPDLCLIDQLKCTLPDGSAEWLDSADMGLNRHFMRQLVKEGLDVQRNSPYPMGRVNTEELEVGKFDKGRIAADYFVFASRPEQEGAVLFENNKDLIANRVGTSGLYRPCPRKIENLASKMATAMAAWHYNRGSRGRT